MTSGIRLGTPAAKTRGMKERQMRVIADLIDRIISFPGGSDQYQSVAQEVLQLTKKFPLYTQLLREK